MQSNIQSIEAQLGQAIYCDCFTPQLNRYKVLGSITSEGLIEILRAHKEKTVIESAEFIIACQDCGYKRHIKLGQSYNN